MRYRSTLRWLLAACLVAAGIHRVQAAEGGQSNYPYGALTSYAALMPAVDDTMLLGYVAQYGSDRVVDADGNTIAGLDVGFVALALRLVHTWKKPWAGFNMSSGVTLEGLHVQVEANGNKDRSTGATMFGLEPLYLTRAFGNLHFLTGPVLYFPLGSYNAGDLANSTLPFFSWAYQLNLSWLPTPRWDLSIASLVEFKSRNTQTRYESGDQGGVTFGISHRPFADIRWDIGVTGFFTEQLQDDRVGDSRVAGGGRTRKLGIGPKVGFWFTPRSTVMLQWHSESKIDNAPEGDLLWLEFGFPL